MNLDPSIFQHAPTILSKLRAESARRSLKAFVEQAWPVIEPGTPLIWGWSMDAICEHLEAVNKRDIKRLVINVPPGMSKSRLTRVSYPCWAWTTDPYHKFLSASYALDLTIRDNLDARRIVTSDWYRNTFGIDIAEDDAGKTGFSLSTYGSMKAVTVGGKTTGFRGDTFIIDDPINVQDANSVVKRAEALEWFREAAQNRINSATQSAIVVIMQRVHEEDVAALAREMGYEHLTIPMRWDEQFRHTTSIGWTDPRTEEGELAFPERFPKEWVDRTEKDMGPYAFAAQYQQTPVPRKGAFFAVEAVDLVDDLPDEDFIAVRAWDLAASAGKGAHTAGVHMLWGRKSQKFYVADVRRGQWGAGQVRDEIDAAATDDGHATRIVLPQDPGQAGKAQVEDLVARLAGFDVRAERQSGDKETRANPFAAQVERGNVVVLRRAWTRAYLDELRTFPVGKYKDQVDASASALNMLASMTRARKRNLRLVVGGEREPNFAASLGIAANG
jgi:predicted phage terminase large subunit-like protein